LQYKLGTSNTKVVQLQAKGTGSLEQTIEDQREQTPVNAKGNKIPQPNSMNIPHAGNRQKKKQKA
jgi:hypothetical protein